MIRQINAWIAREAEQRIWRQPDGHYQVQPLSRRLGVFLVHERTKDRFVSASVALNWTCPIIAILVVLLILAGADLRSLALLGFCAIFVLPFLVYGNILRGSERVQPADLIGPDPVEGESREAWEGLLRQLPFWLALFALIFILPTIELWTEGRQGKALQFGAIVLLLAAGAMIIRMIVRRRRVRPAR